MDIGALALLGESMGWRGPGLGSPLLFWAYLAAAGTAYLPQDLQAGRPITPACSVTLCRLPPLHPGATSPLSLSKALGSAALLEAILPRPLLPSVSVALAGGLDRGGPPAGIGGSCPPLPLCGPPQGLGQLKPQEEEASNQELARWQGWLGLSRSSVAPGAAA